MQYKTLARTLIAACAVLALSGASPYIPAPLYQMERLKLSANDCKPSCAELKVEFPRLLAGQPDMLKKLNASIQQDLVLAMSGEEPEPNLQSAIENFFSEARSFRSDSGMELSWEMFVTISVETYGERILSLRMDRTAFAGGNHPVTTSHYLNYDLKTGQPLKLADLLTPVGRVRLEKVAEARFREDKEIPKEKNLEQAGYWFENNQFYLPENVGLSPGQLTFHYNVYEINAYVYGPTELPVYTYELADIFRPEWRSELAPE